MYTLDTCLTLTHTWIYLCLCTLWCFTPHRSSLHFLHTSARATKSGTLLYQRGFLRINTWSTPYASPPLSFSHISFFIEDQTNSRYLHPLGLFSHSTVVFWYWRAGKGTRLSLSGSLRECCFHLDRYLSSNVPLERPTGQLGDWCTEGDKNDMCETPETL